MLLTSKYLLIILLMSLSAPVQALVPIDPLRSREEAIFDHYNSKDSIKCFNLVNLYYELDKNKVLFVLNNCETIFVSSLLMKMNNDLYLDHKKRLELDPNRIRSKLSKLNIAFFNLYRLKKPNIQLNDRDYQNLWNSSGLYLYYAYILSTKNILGSDTVRSILLNIAEEENIHLDEYFKARNSPLLYFKLVDDYSQHKNVQDFFDSKLWDISSKQLQLPILVKINSKTIRRYIFSSIIRVKNKFIDQSENETSFPSYKEILKSVRESYYQLSLLSYLDKDKDILKQLGDQTHKNLMNKSTLFLLKKSTNNEFSDSYIFFHQNKYLINFGNYHVPDKIKKHKLL